MAVTVRFASRKTVHTVPWAESQLPQVTAVDGLSGAAVNVTVDPVVNPAAHTLPQVMPAGELLIVPVPPVMVTDNVLRALLCGQPWLEGPSTVINAELLTTWLGLS